MARWTSTVLTALAACTAQDEIGDGPSFGGDLRAASAITDQDASTLTEAGLLNALPLAIARVPCVEGLCPSARAVWLDDDQLLVGVALDAVVARPAATVAFALDASGSVAGHEDVRAATVEVALDHLDQNDMLAVWAFTGVPRELVPAARGTPRSVDVATRPGLARASRGLRARQQAA